MEIRQQIPVQNTKRYTQSKYKIIYLGNKTNRFQFLHLKLTAWILQGCWNSPAQWGTPQVLQVTQQMVRWWSVCQPKGCTKLPHAQNPTQIFNTEQQPVSCNPYSILIIRNQNFVIMELFTFTCPAFRKAAL